MIIFGFFSPAEALPPLSVIRSRQTSIRRDENPLNFGFCQERGAIGSLSSLLEYWSVGVLE